MKANKNIEFLINRDLAIAAHEKTVVTTVGDSNLTSQQRAKDKKYLTNAIKYENANPSDYVECQICKYRASTLGSHIRAHGYKSGEDYKKEFPGFLLVCKTRALAISGSNNPGYQHGGKFSPFSKKFVAYASMSEDEKSDAVSKLTNDRTALLEAEPERSPVRIEYYLAKGMTQEEAEDALAERQRTFTLEICIQKHGRAEGTRIWQKRQDKWQDTLNSKPQEEIDEINRKKVTLNNYSTFMNSESDGIFYILRLKNDFVKIGISSRTLKERHTARDLAESQILYEHQSELKTCYQIESIFKEKYFLNRIKKEEQIREFGYTETFRNINPDEIIRYVESTPKEQIEEQFIEVYENFTKREFTERLHR